jgi:4-amino-4-deoxy-L-arabinose transferase-like glycosyltransferase
MIKKNWIFILILIAALLIRIINLDYLELFGDEVDAGYQAYSIMTTGRDYKGHYLPSYAQSFSEWRAPGMLYAMIPFIKIFGLNEYGVRLYSVFWGIISILGTYFLLKEIGVKKSIRLLSIFIITVTPWHIQYSRTAFELTLLSSLIIWGLVFLIKGLRNKQLILIILASICLVSSFYTYNIANILVPLLCLITILNIQKGKNNSRLIIIFIGLSFILCLPLINQIFFGHAADRYKIFSIFNNQDVVRQINDFRNNNNNTLISRVLANKVTFVGKRIIFNYTNAFSSEFLFGQGDITWRHSLHFVGNLYWIELPLLLIGIWQLINKKRWYVLGLLAVAPVASSLTIDGYNHASRLFFMVFPLSFTVAIGLSYLLENKYKRLFGGLIGILFIFELFNYQYYYWNNYRSDSWRWWHYGYKESVQYINSQKNNYKYIFIENTYEPALIRYLFWSKTDPRLIFNIVDKMDYKIEGYDAFCLKDNICFMDYGSLVEKRNFKKEAIYMISQERNIGGDWDWSKNPPDGVRVLKSVRNPKNQLLFYFIKTI